MDKRQASVLGVAIAATLGAGAADAATYVATLKSDLSYSNNGTSSAFLGSSTATWSYDDVTNQLTQTGGTFNARFNITPTTTLFRHSITGLVIGNGAAATASTYTCAEGGFGGTVGASLCGNYNFGANFTNESTVSWGPGTATARTMGGDDGAIGPQQQLNAYDGFTQVSWVGTTLILSQRGLRAAADQFAVRHVAGQLQLRLQVDTRRGSAGRWRARPGRRVAVRLGARPARRGAPSAQGLTPGLAIRRLLSNSSGQENPATRRGFSFMRPVE